MNSTALHRALGVRGGQLTFEMIARACIEKIDEQSDLDWKKSLPLGDPADPGATARSEELAKDIAAMANSDGGLIVYGVDEVRGVDAHHAERVVSIGVVGDSVLKQIRQVANSQIYPPVPGLDFAALSSADGSETVLAMSVPSSEDAPHVVRPKGQSKNGWFAVPYRSGAETVWMVERQIEDAYRRRLVLRERRVRDLQAQLEEFVAGLTGHIWIAAVARPVNARPTRAKRMSPMRAQSVFRTAWDLARESDATRLLPATPSSMLHGEPVLKGLRRYRQQIEEPVRSSDGVAITTYGAVAETHDDGSVALGFTRRGFFTPRESPDDRMIATNDFDRLCHDLYFLIVAASHVHQIGGDYEVRLRVKPVSPLYRRPEPDIFDAYTDFSDASGRKPPFVPVEAFVPLASGDVYDTAEAIVELARDATNQAGVETWLNSSDLGNVIHLDTA